MTVLMHLDSPVEFSVYVDGNVRARIVKEGTSWLLHPFSRPDDALDVTSSINHHEELAPRILAHLARTAEAAA
jgi:hypothetical protein